MGDSRFASQTGSRRLEILIVEDDPALAENLTEILCGFGFGVSAVKSAEGALAHLADQAVDCILTDLKLPGKGGIELIEELRKRDSAVPAIVMSGFVEQSCLDRASSLGVIDIQSKPVDLPRLQTTLSELVDHQSK